MLLTDLLIFSLMLLTNLVIFNLYPTIVTVSIYMIGTVRSD